MEKCQYGEVYLKTHQVPKVEKEIVLHDGGSLELHLYDQLSEHDMHTVPKRSLFYITPQLVCCCHWLRSQLHGLLIIVNISTCSIECMREYRDGKYVFSYLDYIQVGIVDETPSGRRWEGDIIDGIPFGLCEYYDEDNRLSYKGIVIDGERDIWGIQYFALSMELPEYIGFWKNNKKLSVGDMFDRKGNPLGRNPFGGMFDNFTHLYFHVIQDCPLPNLLSCLESIQITRYVGNLLDTLEIKNFQKLSSITIGTMCFNRCYKCLIENLPALTSISIDENSFSHRVYDLENSIFSIKNCQALNLLSIGRLSFRYYERFIIEDTPSICEIKIGGNYRGKHENSFYHVEELNLCNMPLLYDMTCYEKTFHNLQVLHIENCPQLVFKSVFVNKRFIRTVYLENAPSFFSWKMYCGLYYVYDQCIIKGKADIHILIPKRNCLIECDDVETCNSLLNNKKLYSTPYYFPF